MESQLLKQLRLALALEGENRLLKRTIFVVDKRSS